MKDKCHHCHCSKPLGECQCDIKTMQMGCEHCGKINEAGWPKNKND